jgi:hypothetical protein
MRKTAEIPLSSSSVLGASRQHRAKGTTRSIWRETEKGVFFLSGRENNPMDAGFDRKSKELSLS